MPTAAKRRLRLRRDRQYSFPELRHRRGIAVARPKENQESARSSFDANGAAMAGNSRLMPNTIHPTSRPLLAYLDAEFPIDERLEFRTHVAGCQTCRDELDAMEADLDWFLVLEAASRTVKPQVHADG